jgi:hypothetical protein
MTYDQAAYTAFVNECKRVASLGRFDLVSISHAAKACGVPKGQLSQAARACGLTVNETKGGGNGKYGLTADNRTTFATR